MATKVFPVDLPDENDDMYSYFNKSISAVQEHADHFEQVYARPALRTSQAFFDEHPVMATFIAIFVFLSVVPVATFLGVSFFAFASFTIIALTSTVILSATVVLSLLSLLILTLLITFASSAFLTISGISIYSFASLLNLLRIHGSLGLSLWMNQMSGLIFGAFPFPPEPHTSHHEEEDEGHWSDTEDIADQRDIEAERAGLETPSSACEPLLKENGERELAESGYVG